MISLDLVSCDIFVSKSLHLEVKGIWAYLSLIRESPHPVLAVGKYPEGRYFSEIPVGVTPVVVFWRCELCCVRAQLCPTLCETTDCSPPGSSAHGILQARILEWVAISYSRGSSPPRDQSHISCISRWMLDHWATWEAQ